MHTALSLLEVGALSEVSVHEEVAALSEVSVHEEAGFVVEVEGVSFEPRTFSYCEVRFNCWEWMLRSESGFMLPRTEVLACLMIGPAIRHCSAAPNASPAHQAQRVTPASRSGAYGLSSPAYCDGFMYFWLEMLYGAGWVSEDRRWDHSLLSCGS